MQRTRQVEARRGRPRSGAVAGFERDDLDQANGRLRLLGRQNVGHGGSGGLREFPGFKVERLKKQAGGVFTPKALCRADADCPSGECALAPVVPHVDPGFWAGARPGMACRTRDDRCVNPNLLETGIGDEQR